MKPRRLVIDGLRSYRQRSEIDFTDASLFAVVGDTGAGKSSILEAIVYALYAATTWTRQPGELISDGIRTMTVELTFEVDGRAWLVRRSMSRGGYPPPIHYLGAVDDPTERYDGAANVDAKVEALLGLSLDAFTSAVILPQGRFERLLTETPANRTRILKGIFRLERLDQAREGAKALGERYREPFEALRRARAGLLDDPAASAADARRRVAAADSRLEGLRAVDVALADLEAERAQLGRRIDAATSELDLLEEARRGVDPAEGGRLEMVAAELDVVAARLATELEDAEQAERRAIGALDEARARGLDGAALASGRVALEAGRGVLPELRRRRRRVLEEQADIAAAEGQLSRDGERLASLAASTADAVAAEEGARAAAEVARNARDAARAGVERVTELVERLAQMRASLGGQRARARKLADEVDTAARASETAAGNLEGAEAALEAARAQDAAAAAAHGHAPGDPCPVCARTLPAAWRPPASPQLSTSTARLERARADAAAADAVLRAARDELGRAEAQAAAFAEQESALAHEHERAAAQLESLLGGVSDGEPLDQRLAELVEAAANALLANASSRERADAARTAESSAAAELRERRSALDQRARTAQASLAQCEADSGRIAASLATLPADLALSAEATPEDFEAALGRHEGLEQADVERVQALERARAAVSRAASGQRELAGRRRTELDEPLARHRAALTRLAAASERAERLVGADVPAAAAEDESAVARAGTVAAALREVAAGLSAAHAEAQRSAEALLAEHDLPDRAALNEALAAATGERAVAAADLARAEADLPHAAELDARIAAGGRLLTTLAELVRLLGDGQFVGYVVEARQRALLAIASTILGGMSGGRYGFAEDFEIVDRGSGQPRSPKTLSGGETFQASLSLALALVELAGRSGGRLSSLFLDEGFGTLDANALDEALEELERRAAAGRVIGVISHLRAIADRLEHVLRVDKELGRTRVRWVRGHDLERLKEEDLEHVAGLTA